MVLGIGAHQTTTSDYSHIPLPPSPPLIPFIAMPCTILAMPKGGMLGKTHKCYVVHQKLQVLEECPWLMRDHKLSLCGAAAELGILHSLLMRWSAKVPTLVAMHRKVGKCIFNDTSSQLESIKEDLLMWIFVQPEQGLLVTHQQVVMKASALLRGIVLQGKLLQAISNALLSATCTYIA